MATTTIKPNDVVDDDEVSQLHSTASHLTRKEVLQRRLTLTRKLSRIYRRHYWALMELVRAQYRLYVWKYGLTPFANNTNNNNENAPEETNVDNGVVVNNDKLGFGESGIGYKRCGFSGCDFKSMPLTSFCHFHILSDPHQMLYKPCSFVFNRAEQGQILCGKPIMISTVPSLCHLHLPRTLKDVKLALKKAGLTAASSGRLAPKFHVVVAEYVKFIQSKRRAAKNRYKKVSVIKDDSSG